MFFLMFFSSIFFFFRFMSYLTLILQEFGHYLLTRTHYRYWQTISTNALHAYLHFSRKQKMVLFSKFFPQNDKKFFFSAWCSLCCHIRAARVQHVQASFFFFLLLSYRFFKKTYNFVSPFLFKLDICFCKFISF